MGCCVGELERASDITGRVNVGEVGLQVVVDLHGATDRYAQFLQTKALQPCTAAHGAKQLVELDPFLNAAGFHHDESTLVGALTFSLAAQRFVFGQHLNAIGHQRRLRERRDVLVFSHHDARCHLNLCHRCAEPRKTLGQFATDRAATEHHQPLG